ncbi:hypothetical protein [Saccharopolyspora spinosa]|uniref:hypothetical protein n=1 Tax=Saccharopolyspora spinosa TaxID=60894 RepID=UPI0011D22B7F|nr:hypothetical protein [Saccharopolyspora spinosa]
MRYDTAGEHPRTRPQAPPVPGAAVSCTDTELATHIRELEQAMRVSMMEQLRYIAEAGHRGLHNQRWETRNTRPATGVHPTSHSGPQANTATRR